MALHFETGGGVSGGTNTETAIATLQVTPPQGASTPVATGLGPTRILGVLNISLGTGLTNFFIKVRQGNGLSGASLTTGSVAITPTPSTTIQVPFSAFDPQGASVYTVTVQQLSGTSAATVNNCSIDVDNNLSGIE
jgi:hypothetical protein